MNKLDEAKKLLQEGFLLSFTMVTDEIIETSKNMADKIIDLLHESITNTTESEENELICPVCKSDDHFIYGLYHTYKGTPNSGAYCQKCKIIVWEEEHEE